VNKWDERIWRWATNPLVIAFAALLQMRTLAVRLRAGGEVEQVILLEWLIPFGVTIALATAVAIWGWRNFWPLSRTVLVGLAAVLAAQPIVRLYLRLVLDAG
jgi:hypothetical protein